MPSAKEEGEESPREHGDEDAPDWTSWLRSRLERVSTSERTAAENAAAASEAAVGGEEPAVAATSAPEAPPAEDTLPPEPQGRETASQEPFPGGDTLGTDSVTGRMPRSDDELPGWDSGPEEARWAPASPPPVVKPVPPSAPPDTAVAVEIEALRAAVTTLVAGVGTLSDTFSSFRDVVNDRLRDYSEMVLRLSQGTAADVEEYHQRHAASTAELQRNDAEINERLQSLAGGMESLAELQRNDAEINERLQGLAEATERLAVMRGDDERWAEVMGRLLDEVDAERQANEREALTAGGVVERLDGLEQALRGVTAEVSEGMGRLLDEVEAERRAAEGRANEREGQSAGVLAERLDGLEQALHRVAEEVSALTAAQRSAAEVVPEVPTPGPDSPPAPLARPRPRPRGGRTAPLRAERRIGR